MDDQTANSAREYYEMIVNDDSSYFTKKSLIYDDLVVGTKTELSMWPYYIVYYVIVSRYCSVSLYFGIFP